MIYKSILDSGIRVISENIPHAYSVSIGIWVANGSRHEGRESNGVAHFIEHLLFKGTERRGALDIAREIDSIGGILNAFTSREYVCYYAKVLDKFLPNAVDLLSDIFLNSLFNSEEIEKERKVILQEISMLEDTPDDYIHDLFSQNFWQGHPLGMPIIGNEESVGGLSRDFIVSYKQDKYRAGDIIIAAAGKVEHQELLRLLGGLFARIPSGKSSEEPYLATHEKKIDIIEKDLEQVHLCLGTRALPQNHPNRYEAYILNTVLGGSMSSRLFQEVREKLGLAYSIYSYMASHSDTGSLAVYAGTSQERVNEVIEIILREFKKLKTDPLSPAELDSAKEQLKGNILLSLESSDNRMSKLAKNEIYFGCYQPLPEIIKGFDRVTSESLLGLCERLIDGDYLTLVLMGKVERDSPFLADITL
ncbi:MAG: peptidase M16 domain-containing [Geobacteraceae bacterium]|nr:MAG: peptidase M16 domain-containing [Geobacteraceae bacterium]